MALVGLSVISIFQYKRHYIAITYPQADNGEGNGWQITIQLVSFWYFPWDFPASRGLSFCLYNIILYVIS